MLSYPVLSYPILSYPILSYPASLPIQAPGFLLPTCTPHYHGRGNNRWPKSTTHQTWMCLFKSVKMPWLTYNSRVHDDMNLFPLPYQYHYDDVRMGAIASQITSLTIVYSTVYSDADKKTSKLRVTGLCVGNSPGEVTSPHKGPVTRKMFPFDDVIMTLSIYGPEDPVHQCAEYVSLNMYTYAYMFVFDLRSAQVYCFAIILVSQEVSLNFHRCCG